MLEQPVERLLVADDVIRGSQLRPGIGELHCGEATPFAGEDGRVSADRQAETAQIVLRPLRPGEIQLEFQVVIRGAVAIG